MPPPVRVAAVLRVLPLAVLSGCNPYGPWPDPTSVFPWVYTPETDLPPYALVRVETETWTPLVDLEETGLYIQKATYHKPSAPFEERLHFAELRPRIPPVRPRDPLVTFVGDVMHFGGNWSHFADGVADDLDGLRVGNLETPIDPDEPTDLNDLVDEWGVYAVNSPVELLDGLPLDLVQINNNHSLDVGDAGLEQTWAQVTDTGRVAIGMDENGALAQLDTLRVAFLSYTWGVNNRDPSAHDLFVVPFGHLDEDIDLSRIEDQVRAARRDGATHVVLLLHWGFEYEYYPDPHFLQLGRELVALGADLVVGTGPHAVEPAEICDVNRPRSVPGVGTCSVRDLGDARARTAAVVYSLGDFGTELATAPLQVGIAVTASLDAGGVSGLGWRAVASTPAPGAGEALAPLGSSTDPDHAGEQARLDALLGTAWKRAR